MQSLSEDLKRLNIHCFSLLCHLSDFAVIFYRSSCSHGMNNEERVDKNRAWIIRVNAVTKGTIGHRQIGSKKKKKILTFTYKIIHGTLNRMHKL